MALSAKYVSVAVSECFISRAIVLLALLCILLVVSASVVAWHSRHTMQSYEIIPEHTIFHPLCCITNLKLGITKLKLSTNLKLGGASKSGHAHERTFRLESKPTVLVSGHTPECGN